MPLAKKWKSVIIIHLKMITKWYMDNIAYLYLSIRRSRNSVEIFELWEKLLLSRSKLAGSGSGREILFFFYDHYCYFILILLCMIMVHIHIIVIILLL